MWIPIKIAMGLMLSSIGLLEILVRMKKINIESITCKIIKILGMYIPLSFCTIYTIYIKTDTVGDFLKAMCIILVIIGITQVSFDKMKEVKSNWVIFLISYILIGALTIYFTRYALNSFHLRFMNMFIWITIFSNFKVKLNHDKVVISGLIICFLVLVIVLNCRDVIGEYSKPRRCATSYIKEKGYGVAKYNEMYIHNEEDTSRFKPIEIIMKERNIKYERVRRLELVYFKGEIISFKVIDETK